MKLKIENAFVIPEKSFQTLTSVGKKLEWSDAEDATLEILDIGSFGLVVAISSTCYRLSFLNLEKRTKIVPVEDARNLCLLSEMLVSSLNRIEKDDKYINCIVPMLSSAESFKKLVGDTFKNEKATNLNGTNQRNMISQGKNETRNDSYPER